MAGENSVQMPVETPVKQMSLLARGSEQPFTPPQGLLRRHSISSIGSHSSGASSTKRGNILDSSPVVLTTTESPSTPPSEYFHAADPVDNHSSPSRLPRRQRTRPFGTKVAADTIPDSESNDTLHSAESVQDNLAEASVPWVPEELPSEKQIYASEIILPEEFLPHISNSASTEEQDVESFTNRVDERPSQTEESATSASNQSQNGSAKVKPTKRKKEDSPELEAARQEARMGRLAGLRPRKVREPVPGLKAPPSRKPPSKEPNETGGNRKLKPKLDATRKGGSGLAEPQIAGKREIPEEQEISHEENSKPHYTGAPPSPSSQIPPLPASKPFDKEPPFEKYYLPELSDCEIKQLLIDDLNYKTPKAKRSSQKCVPSSFNSNHIEQPSIKTEAESFGYIYIYKSLKAPGYVKIGSTDRPANERRGQWGKKCYLRIEAVHDPNERPLPHFRFVEKLIHHDLAKYRRRFECCKCKSSSKPRKNAVPSGGTKVVKYTQHREWFEISDELAVAVVQKWRAWMINNEPYDCEGQLTGIWVEKYQALIKNFGDVDDWLKAPTAAEKTTAFLHNCLDGANYFAKQLDYIGEASLDICYQVCKLSLTVLRVICVLAIVIFITQRCSFEFGLIAFVLLVKR